MLLAHKSCILTLISEILPQLEGSPLALLLFAGIEVQPACPSQDADFGKLDLEKVETMV